MIFVIFGTEHFPFNRLAQEVDHLVYSGFLRDEVHMQLGTCTYEPLHCAWKRFIPFDEMVKTIQKADTVIAHAGAGTTLLCLDLKKTPIIVTRQKKYKEHVDDHQIPFAESMERLKLTFVAYDVSELKQTIEKTKKTNVTTNQLDRNNKHLISYLNEYCASVE